jgi:hypothetical protein
MDIQFRARPRIAGEIGAISSAGAIAAGRVTRRTIAFARSSSVTRKPAENI